MTDLVRGKGADGGATSTSTGRSGAAVVDWRGFFFLTREKTKPSSSSSYFFFLFFGLEAEVCTRVVGAAAVGSLWLPFVIATSAGAGWSSFCCRRALCLREPLCSDDMDRTCKGGRATKVVMSARHYCRGYGKSRRYRVGGGVETGTLLNDRSMVGACRWK